MPRDATPDLAEEEPWPIASGGDEVPIIPWPILFRRRLASKVRSSDRYRWWVLWTVLAGLFSVNVTFTLIAVALPEMAGDLGTTENTLTWAITGPLLAFGIVAPIAGKLGDLHGHRKMYLLGLAGAGVFIALASVSWNAGSLIAFRIGSSIEGAATGSASMALVFSVFDRGDRIKAMGWWSLVGAGGPVIGVAIGGAVIDAFGWRPVFAVQAPLCLLAVLLAVIVLPETARGTRKPFDIAGAATLSLSVTALLWAMNRGPEAGWTSPLVVAGFVLAPILAVAFVRVERRTEHPLLPLHYLRRRNFAFPLAANTLANFAYMGGFILAPQLLGDVFGYEAKVIGLIVIARPLAFSIMAPVAGYVAVRTGERSAAVVGTSCVAASMVVFALLDPQSNPALVVFALALSGIGLGISSPSIAASSANAVEDENLGIATASQQLMNQVGIVAGIQMMSTVQASREAGRGLVESFGDAYLLGGLVCVGAVICAAFIHSAPRDQKDASRATTDR